MAEAKRTPESGRDYAELLRRFNVVAEDVLGCESDCTLVVLHECGASLHRQLHDTGISAEQLSNLGALPESLWNEDTGSFAVPMCLQATATVWRTGDFDRFFSRAVQGQLSALLVESDHGQVFAPYDGGVDVFYASSWERDRARAKYRGWLSPRSDGL